jgi:hypothetical protein
MEKTVGGDSILSRFLKARFKQREKVVDVHAR